MAEPPPRRAWWLLGAAALAEGLAWGFAAANRTDTFAWFRIQDRLGALGLVGAALAGLLAGAVVLYAPPKLRASWSALGVAALLVHAPMFHVAQGHLDSIRWFTHAQAMARMPLTFLGLGPRKAFFPLVPGVQGALFAGLGETPLTMAVTRAGWFVALVAAVAWGGATTDESGRRRPAWLAAALVGTTPLLWAQSGWFLADLPLCATLAFAWGAARRAAEAPSRRTLGLVVVAALLALATKAGAALFLATTLPILVPWRPPRGVLVGGAFVLVAAAAVLLAGMGAPLRLRPVAASAAAALSIGLHLRPALWVAAGWALVAAKGSRLGNPDAACVAGAALATLALVPWAPPEHAARYALPALVPLAWWVSRQAPGVGAFAIGSGVVLGLGGYRPIVVHSQAENLREAVRALESAGATAIEVQADMPRSALPVAGIAAIVDIEAVVPVRTGTQIASAAPAAKVHWWEHLSAPPWRGAGTADAVLLACAGGECADLDPAAYAPVCDVALERGSSLLLPTRVRGFRRK